MGQVESRIQHVLYNLSPTHFASLFSCPRITMSPAWRSFQSCDASMPGIRWNATGRTAFLPTAHASLLSDCLYTCGYVLSVGSSAGCRNNYHVKKISLMRVQHTHQHLTTRPARHPEVRPSCLDIHARWRSPSHQCGRPWQAWPC